MENEQILVQPPKKRSLRSKIARIVWDADDKPEEERKFVRKLDFLLMTIAMFGYFVKYLSQANISNAYATGMKESLHFKGNQYNTLLTMFTAGYVIGQFPGTLLMVRVSPSIWLPACEAIWTVLVMCCAATKNVHTLYGLRFAVGLLEASAYPGMLWVLGSWYGPVELGKRVVMFQATSSVGTMFSGYLQAAVHAGLNGRGGLEGWRWLFIMDGVICLPIAIAGFFCIPDTPAKLNPRVKWYLKEKDVDMALERNMKFARAPSKGFSKKIFKEVFTTWIPWAFFVPYTCYVVGLGSYAYMNLWLKSTKQYGNATDINVIPTGGYALSILMSCVYSWTSDALKIRWPILLFGGIPPLIGNIILSTWPVSNSAKFAGFFLNFTATSIGAIALAWANELLSESAEARAITIGFLNTAAYVFNSWAPNVIWPASQAPHYKAGYKVAVAFFGTWIIGICVIIYLVKNHPVTKFKEEYQETLVAQGKADPTDEEEGDEKAREADPVDLEQELQYQQVEKGATVVAAGVEPRATNP